MLIFLQTFHPDRDTHIIWILPLVLGLIGLISWAATKADEHMDKKYGPLPQDSLEVPQPILENQKAKMILEDGTILEVSIVVTKTIANLPVKLSIMKDHEVVE